MFASPERALLFDVNDFDETLPGPFEYDVKRTAASFVIAGRNNGFATADTRAVALASVTAYRKAMAEFAQMGTMDLWCAHYDEDRLQQLIQGAVAEAGKVEKKDKKAEAAKAAKAEKKKEQADARQDKVVKKAARRAEKSIAKAHTHDSTQALSKLAELVDGQYRIVSQPPVIVPARDLAATYGLSPDDVMPTLHEQFRAYRATLPDDRRKLLEKFQIVDAGPRPVRRPGRDGLLPRPRRRFRPVGHRLLRTLRRPERAGLRAVRQGDPGRATRSGRGCMKISSRVRAACGVGAR